MNNNKRFVNNSRIEHIDVWRCIAICLVIFVHVVYFSHPWYKQVIPGLVWRTSPLAPLGVRLFFCISGFVICRGMLKEFHINGRLNMRAFYVRRAFRIFPPLLLYIGVLATLSFAELIELNPGQVFFSLGFLCNASGIDCGWFLAHTWSLAFEEQFYLIFPLLFVLVGLAQRRDSLLLIAFAMLITIISAQVTGHEKVGYFVSTFSFMVWGCVFALYWDKLQPLLAKIPLPIWLLATAALFSSKMVIMPAVYHHVIFPAFGPIACCLVVFGTPTHHPVIGLIFGNSKLQYVGRISYSIYLWQQLATANFGFSSPLSTLYFIPGIFLISHLSFRYFEARMITIGTVMSARLMEPVPAILGGSPIFNGEVIDGAINTK